MEPLVSILIPCYNSERWIAETLRSAAGQTWPNVEIIVVDDGSKDRSFAIASSFQTGNIQVCRQANQGASAARNAALNQAQGEFIQYLDADDLLSADKIETQVRLLQNSAPNLLAVSATRHFFDGENPAEGILYDGWPMVDSNDPVEWLINLLGPESGSMVQPGAWLTPRSIVGKIGPWNEILTVNDDGEYFARAVLVSAGTRRSPAGLNYYRKFRRGSSLSMRKNEAHFASAMIGIDLIGRHLFSRSDDPRARQALARVYMEFAVDAYPVAARVSAAACKKAAALGGAKRPAMGTPAGESLAKIIGWRAIRWASHHYHQARGKFK